MKKPTKVLSIILAMVIAITLAVPAFAGKTVDSVQVTFNDKIAGKTENDYKDYISVDGEQFTIIDKGIYNCKLKGYLDSSTKLVAGDEYIIEVAIVGEAEDTFVNGTTKLYINGKEISSYYTGTVPSNVAAIAKYAGRSYIVASIDFTAKANTDKLIDTVNISLDGDLVGKTTLDYKDYFTFSTEHCKYWDLSDLPSAHIYDMEAEDYIEFSTPLVAGKSYGFDLYLVAEDGYGFAEEEDLKVYVNGNLPESFETYTYESKNCLCVSYAVKVVSEKYCIDTVYINFDNEIAGKTLWDYEDFFTFSTNLANDNISYYADSTMGAVDIYDSETESYLEYDTKLVKGEEYDFELYMLADKGYYFSDDLVVYVNGVKVDDDYFYTYDVEGGDFIGRESLCVELTETVKKQPSFLVRLFRAIKNFFANLFVR